MKSLKCVVLFCLYLTTINTEISSAQGILNNGGFESPAISSNTNQDVDPLGWTRIGSIGGAITHLFNGNGGISNFPMPHGGNQQFYLGSSGTGIFQNFTIVNSGPLRLSWWTTTETSENIDPIIYTVRIWNNAGSSLIFGNQFATQSTNWISESMDVSLQPGSYQLEFLTIDVFNSYGTLLDDVTMVPVPEPRTFALFGISALGIIAMQLRRK